MSVELRNATTNDDSVDVDVEKHGNNTMFEQNGGGLGSSFLTTSKGKGLNIDFRNICLTLNLKGGGKNGTPKQRKILSNITGKLHAGKFTAILGPSGE